MREGFFRAVAEYRNQPEVVVRDGMIGRKLQRREKLRPCVVVPSELHVVHAERITH